LPTFASKFLGYFKGRSGRKILGLAKVTVVRYYLSAKLLPLQQAGAFLSALFLRKQRGEMGVKYFPPLGRNSVPPCLFPANLYKFAFQSAK
jgi:hypothetical protein